MDCPNCEAEMSLQLCLDPWNLDLEAWVCLSCGYSQQQQERRNEVMDDKTKDRLVRVLDMDETEMRATLIAVVNGISVDEAIDGAYNVMRREAIKLRPITD